MLPQSAILCKQALTPSASYTLGTSLAEGGMVCADNAHRVRIISVGGSAHDAPRSTIWHK